MLTSSGAGSVLCVMSVESSDQLCKAQDCLELDEHTLPTDRMGSTTTQRPEAHGMIPRPVSTGGSEAASVTHAVMVGPRGACSPVPAYRRNTFRYVRPSWLHGCKLNPVWKPT